MVDQVLLIFLIILDSQLSVDDVTYTFQTREVHTGADDGAWFTITFKTTDDSTAIPIFEGILKTKTFTVGEFNEADVYMIPDTTLDADTAIVRVIDGSNSTSIRLTLLQRLLYLLILQFIF